MGERFRPEGRESTYAPEVLELAKQAAQQLITNPDLSVVSFAISPRGGELWLSADPKLVVGTEHVVVEGKAFFIGLFKAEK